MTSRHLWPEWVVVALLVVLVLVGLPSACVAETVSKTETVASSWSLLGRYSSSDNLGYDDHGIGLALWRDHCGEKLCLRSEAVATTASKADGSSSYAGIVTIEERFKLGDEWWIGAASRWNWRNDGEGWSDQFMVGAGWSDETEEGRGQAIHVRILFPDSTQYGTNGYEVRWSSLYPKWIIAIEYQHVAYEILGQRSWGKRVSLLAGIRR